MGRGGGGGGRGGGGGGNRIGQGAAFSVFVQGQGFVDIPLFLNAAWLNQGY